jgi:hypothetical protein
MDLSLSNSKDRFDGLGSRLARKADSSVVSLGGATLTTLIASTLALTKWQ